MSEPAMINHRPFLSALLLSALLLATVSPVRAAPDGKEGPAERFDREMRQAQELLRQGLDRMAQSVETLMRAMPRYEMPTMNENGDIIIKRKKRPASKGGADSFLEPAAPTI
jgi:hypothetical protein